MTRLSLGAARHEVRSIDLPIRKGKNRPSRAVIASAIATESDALQAEAHVILSQERMGYDEYEIVVLFFWRIDQEVS